MQPSENFSVVLNGKRYSVATSTLIASDCYWDGRNNERLGRNTFLYQNRGGVFFKLIMTMWQGETTSLVPLSRTEAMKLYETLAAKEEDYEDTFDVVLEDASEPVLHSDLEKEITVWLPTDQIDWLKQQPGTLSSVVLQLVSQAMPN